jgi:hypothetical protein
MTMQRPPTERSRVSIPEICLTLIIGAAMLGGIYGVYKLAMSDKKIDSAIAQIDEIRQLDFTATDGSLTHPWEGKISSEHKGKGLTVTLDAVPSSACLQVAEHYMSADSDFISLTIGQMEFGEGKESLSAESIAAACTKSDKISMVWHFN